jgi:hypothetical protein
MHNPQGRVTIGVYVDDLIITSTCASLVRSTIKAIQEKYLQLKVHEGLVHNYLGMVLDFTEPGYVHINQSGMIAEITRSPSIATIEHAVGKIEKNPSTPANEYLFQSSPDSPPFSPELAKEVHSLTARILFIANRGRPDIVCAI